MSLEDLKYEKAPLICNTTEFATEIWVDVVMEDQKARIVGLIKARRRWKIVQNWVEAISQAIIAIGAVMSFAAGFWDDKILSFVSGSISSSGVALYAFSKYAANESAERNTSIGHLWHEIAAGPTSANGPADPVDPDDKTG